MCQQNTSDPKKKKKSSVQLLITFLVKQIDSLCKYLTYMYTISYRLVYLRIN